MNLCVIHAKKLTGSPLRGSESSEIILRRAPQTWMLLVVGENRNVLTVIVDFSILFAGLVLLFPGRTLF